MASGPSMSFQSFEAAMNRRHTAPDVASADAPVKKKKKLRLSERVGTASKQPIGSAASSSSGLPSRANAEHTELDAEDAVANGEPTAETEGRLWTVSIALPGSIVDNAQTHELRSQLVGQVARACAIFNVDEIVVFKTEGDTKPPNAGGGGDGDGFDSAHPFKDKKRVTPSSIFMARLLQYLECPQYLRKHIFPVHPDLRSVGLIAPLDAPHHLRIDEPSDYREAVVVPAGSIGSRDAASSTVAAAQALEDGGGDDDEGGDNGDGSGSSSAFTGLRKEMKINHSLPVGTRVTLKMPNAQSRNARQATVVPPKEPRELAGKYWGFEVRVASSLAEVWSGCPHEDGYDLAIGTSEHGTPSLHAPPIVAGDAAAFALRPFRHVLIVFGGVEGLEPAVSGDDSLCEVEDNIASLFDHYLNLCPDQGSRTIRTEEALLVGLSSLKPLLEAAGGEGQAGGFEMIPK